METTIDAQIHRVGVSATEKQGMIRRACRLVFFREFDTELADAIGGAARGTLRQLKGGDLADATIKIDAITVRCTVEVMGKEITIPVLRGNKAKAKAANGEKPPVIRLLFNHDFDPEVFAFLGQHCASQARVTFTPVQASLVKDDETAAAAEGNGDGKKKGRGRRKAAASTETAETTAETH